MNYECLDWSRCDGQAFGACIPYGVSISNSTRRPYYSIWWIDFGLRRLTDSSRENGRFPRERAVSSVLILDVHTVTNLRLVYRHNF